MDETKSASRSSRHEKAEVCRQNVVSNRRSGLAFFVLIKLSAS